MEIRKNLEANFLTCKVCKEAFRQPKVLICMHTFCKQCLEGILEREKLDAAKKRREIETQRSSGYSSSSSTSAYKGRWSSAFKSPILHKNETYATNGIGYSKHRFSDDEIECPECQKRTTLPLSGVHGLPDDQVAGKLALLVGSIPKYPTCDVCSAGICRTFTVQPIETPNMPEASKLYIPQHSWTDAEDDSTSDPQTTEDDEDNYSMVTRRSSGFQYNMYRHGRRFNPIHKLKSMNISDDERVDNKFSSVHKDISEPKQAISICLECTKRLCAVCQANHTKTAVTSDHVVLPLEKINELSCSSHPRELKRFYCLTCGELICLVCTFGVNCGGENTGSSQESLDLFCHAGHDVLPIRQSLTALGNIIKNLNSECQQRAVYVENILYGFRTCERHFVSLKHAINSAADALIQSIISQKTQLLRDIDNDLGVNSETFSNQCELLHGSLDTWEKLREENEDENHAEVLNDHQPLDALSEAGNLRKRYLACLNLLTTTVPHGDGWINLIAEIENLQLRADQRRHYDTVSSGICAESIENSKVCKRVRFAPVDDISDIISSSQSTYWRRRLGTFIPGNGAQLGRRMTPSQLAMESRALTEKFVSRAVQASPTDIYGKPLPAERDSHRHRAIQTNLLNIEKNDSSTQTDVSLFSHVPLKVMKNDFGTQYASSDVNTPISFFRSSKQILVQK